MAALVKTDSCESCHQLGNQYTRTTPTNVPVISIRPRRPGCGACSRGRPAGRWWRSESAGPRPGHGGVRRLDHSHRTRANCPLEAPPRPQGVERNIVITQWDWADPKAYLHDEIATDKRNPSVNANGLLYGSPEESRDYLPVLDPVNHSISQVKVPYRDPDTPGQPKPLQPSPVWGDEAIWDSHTTVHNPMFDERGRVWYTGRIRANANPAFCKAGSDLVSAKLTPLATSGRQLGRLRSGNEGDVHDRHLLQHPSSGVRFRCE